MDQANQQIEQYLDDVLPLRWVFWWHNAEDPLAKQQLEAVLFDAETDRQRDFTQPEIREQVSAVVLSSPYLRSMLAEEVREHFS